MTENIKCPCCGSGNICERDSDDERNWFCYTCLCDWPEHERQPPNAWIACSERLPKEVKLVLIYFDNGQIEIDYLVCGEWNIYRERNLRKGSDGIVTHWQPFPQPPIKKEINND